VPRCWQQEGCRGGLFEERPGLPRTGDSWFQPAPADPAQGTAEPLSQGGSTGKECCTATVREGNVKNMREIALQAPRWEKTEGEEVLQASEKRSPCSPRREHGGPDIHIADRGRPHAGISLFWTTAAYGKDSHWSCYGLTATPIPHLPCTAWGSIAGKVSNKRVKMSLGKKRGEMLL